MGARNYIAKVCIKNLKGSTGAIGETVFYNWFTLNFGGEVLHKQDAENDFKGIDFVCNKGHKYQVKATKKSTYTFNSKIETLPNYLTSDYYVLIQITDNFAYIEALYNQEYILDNAKASYNSNTSFVWKKKLNEQNIDLNQLFMFK